MCLFLYAMVSDCNFEMFSAILFVFSFKEL